MLDAAVDVQSAEILPKGILAQEANFANYLWLSPNWLMKQMQIVENWL